MKIKCIVVDDEPGNLSLLKSVIEDIRDVEVVKSCTSAAEFRLAIKDTNFDLCILDNRLQDGKGIEISRELEGIEIIIVSAHEIGAADAFDASVSDVLMKPVKPDRLAKAIRKCRDRIINRKQSVFIKIKNTGTMQFKTADVVMATTIKNSEHKILYTADGELYETSKTQLEILRDQLGERFYIANNNTLINIDHIKCFSSRNTIQLTLPDKKNGTSYTEVSLSDIYGPTLKTLLGIK